MILPLAHAMLQAKISPNQPKPRIIFPQQATQQTRDLSLIHPNSIPTPPLHTPEVQKILLNGFFLLSARRALAMKYEIFPAIAFHSLCQLHFTFSFYY